MVPFLSALLVRPAWRCVLAKIFNFSASFQLSLVSNNLVFSFLGWILLQLDQTVGEWVLFSIETANLVLRLYGVNMAQLVFQLFVDGMKKR